MKIILYNNWRQNIGKRSHSHASNEYHTHAREGYDLVDICLYLIRCVTDASYAI
ncbi:MAG TPA: hypothetical protein VF242_07685 [Nitrososphaeraceae archaeon]